MKCENCDCELFCTKDPRVEVKDGWFIIWECSECDKIYKVWFNIFEVEEIKEDDNV